MKLLQLLLMVLPLSLLLIPGGILFGQVPSTGNPAQWGPEVQLTTASGDVWGHALAASGSTVHMVWGTGQVVYRRSTDEGLTWSANKTLASGWIHPTDVLAAQGANVWVLYLADIRQDSDWCCVRRLGRLYLCRSQDGGLSWEPAKPLTTGNDAFRISLAVSGSTLHLVWMDYRTGGWDVYYRRSVDSGSSWQPEVRLAVGDRPQIAVLGDTVHVVWMMIERPKERPNGEILYKRSLDGGNTWGPNVQLTSNPGLSIRPDIATALPSSVVIAYDADNNGPSNEQYVLRSADLGSNWEAPTRMSFALKAADHSALIGAGSAVHLAWHDSREAGNQEIYYRLSLDSGATWMNEERVSQAGTISTTPFLATTPGYLHVIWLDNRTGRQQVWYRRRVMALTLTPTPPPTQ